MKNYPVGNELSQQQSIRSDWMDAKADPSCCRAQCLSSSVVYVNDYLQLLYSHMQHLHSGQICRILV